MMNNDIQVNKHELMARRSFPIASKGKSDLVVLRYMARRIWLTASTLAQTEAMSRPLLYYVDERHRNTHRIAMYRPQELLLDDRLLFVGFVSGRLKPIDPAIATELHVVDKKLVDELVNIAGLLSYSSMELPDGNWCNLVLLSDVGAKTELRDSETHMYAAYRLAPHCYDWVRIHHGVMPAGLAGNDMVLLKTKYYRFLGEERKFAIREVQYEA